MSSTNGFSTLRTTVASIAAHGPMRADGEFKFALGPCAIESEAQLVETAATAAELGATHLRGGAVKLRTRSSSYHGPGPEAWPLMRDVGNQYDLRTVSEVTAVAQVSAAAEYIDILQIGARNMWNHALLEAVAATGKEILIKRGIGATTDEWLWSAHRLLTAGAKKVTLCERGLPSIDTCSRNSVDLATLMFLIHEGPLDIWLDVSHSAGDPKVAHKMLQASKALRLGGVMAEIHPEPSQARCDGHQAIPTAWLRNSCE